MLVNLDLLCQDVGIHIRLLVTLYVAEAASIVVLELVGLIEHGPVGRLLVEPLIKWQTVHVLVPSNLVGETPGDEGLAIWLREANLKELTIVLGLQLFGRVVPIAGMVPVIAGDVNLSDLGLDADLGVSLHVLADALTTVLQAIVQKVGRDVGLEADSVYWTSPVLQTLDQIVKGI